MDRLSAIDASFLYMETPESPMHVAGLAIFEPSGNGDEPVFERFREHMAARLHLLPFFERRLNLLPATLDNPVWVHDTDLDLDYHIRQMALPRPGTMDQLRSLVARLHTVLLDRARPLWQYDVIQGLKGGGFAVYVKMHHAGIDGGAGVAALDIIFASSPGPSTIAVPPRPRSARAQEPNVLELISGAYAEFYRQQLNMMTAWPAMSQAIANVWRRTVEDLSRRPPPLSAPPKTLFNVSLSKQRSFGTASVSLSDVKALGKASNAKVNDVVMAICAGALRRYLSQHKALPNEPLIAAVPVSLREAGDTAMNNQVTMMLCSLATDVADPLQRLAAITAASRDAKARLGDVKDALPKDISIFGAPIIMTGLAQWAERVKAADQLPAMMNVLISNVAGPRKPMYCAGAKCIGYFPVSIPAQGNALNMTVHSYLDSLDFGLIACREAVPDIQVMADFLVDEFEALKLAAKMPAGVAAVAQAPIAPAARAKPPKSLAKTAAAKSKAAKRHSEPVPAPGASRKGRPVKSANVAKRDARK